MILDKLENADWYYDSVPGLKEFMKFYNDNDLEEMPACKIYLDGKDLFVNITTAKGKAPDEAVLETHVKMIDIQIPIDGPETYGYTPLCRLPELEYNAEKDITKYPDMMAESFIDCLPGMFAIFFPQDGHAPCISMAPEIKKAIFKVKA